MWELWRKGLVTCSHPCLNESAPGVSLSSAPTPACLHAVTAYQHCVNANISLYHPWLCSPTQETKKKREKETGKRDSENAETLPEMPTTTLTR